MSFAGHGPVKLKGVLQLTCTWRLFSQYNNESHINSWTYGIEMAFHEALLQVCPALLSNLLVSCEC